MLLFLAYSLSVTRGSQDKPFFGCVSNNVCRAAAALSYLPFLESLGNITDGPSCCRSAGCNAVPKAVAVSTAAAVTLPDQQNCVIVIISRASKLSMVLLHLLLGLFVSVLYLE